MASDDVLKEFIVALGFRVDEEKHKVFQRSLKMSTEEVGKLGLAITSVSVALAAGFERIADQFQSLYYISQRTGTTITNLKDLQYAAGQVGGSAEAMTQALMQAQVLMQQPGGTAMVSAFTGFRGQITSAKQELGIILDYLHKLYAGGGTGPFMARQIAGALNLNYDALLPDIINRPKEKAAQADYDARARAMGMTAKEMQDLGQKSVDFENELSKLWSEIGLVAAHTEADFIDPVTKALKSLTAETGALANAFGGLGIGERRALEGITAIVAAGGGLAATLAALRTLRGLLGFGGGAAAAGGGAGAAAAGGGLSIGGAVGRTFAAAGALVSGFALGKWLEPYVEQTRIGHAALGAAGGLAAGIGAELTSPSVTAPDAIQRRLKDQAGTFIPLPGAGLYHKMAYRPGGDDDRGGSYSLASDLQDWLHGSSSFVPMVRLLGFGDTGTGYGNGVIPASYEPGSGGGGSQAPLGPGGTPGKMSAGGAAMAARLYKHARAPVDEGGLGMDRAHALAMIGAGAFAESYLNPAAVGDNGTSFGMFQEHGARGTAMMGALGPNWRNDPLGQLDFAFKEQQQRDPGWFQRGGSAGDLGNDFERGFERPKFPTDRSAFVDGISRALGSIGGTRLGTGVTHNHGDKNVTINQGDMHVTVHGNAGDAAGAMRTAHNRVLGDAVRNIAPVLA